jgi:hypothetical protein
MLGFSGWKVGGDATAYKVSMGIQIDVLEYKERRG